MPKVGIVIAAFNADKYLKETLTSIQKQTFRDLTCIVVDDGSSDNTAAIATQLEATDNRFRTISIPNQGPCVARNVGLAELPTDVSYVSFMDADDVYRPEAIQMLYQTLVENDDHIGAYGLAEFIIETGTKFRRRSFADECRRRIDCATRLPRRVPLTAPSSFSNMITSSTMFPPGRVLAKYSAYKQVGGFDEQMRYAEDWDVLIRLSRLGNFKMLNEIILDYRRHANNQGMSPEVPIACKKVFIRTYYSKQNSKEHQVLVRRGWRARQILDAEDRIKRIAQNLKDVNLGSILYDLSRLPLLLLRYIVGRPLSWRRCNLDLSR